MCGAEFVFSLYLFGVDALWLAAVGALLFAVMMLYGVIQFSYRLARIPDALQGSINSVFRLIVFSGDPIGFALTSLLLQIYGMSGSP